MKHMWAPWRMEYIEHIESKECIFCKNDEQMTVIKNDDYIILMNKFPYNNGHIMVAPIIHNTMIEELNPKELTALFEGVQLGVKIIKKVYSPDGINVGINMGRSAGAGICDHLHIHIVPRWNGDTNFMPIFNDTKLISEALEKTRNKFINALREIENGE